MLEEEEEEEEGCGPPASSRVRALLYGIDLYAEVRNFDESY